MSYSLPALPYEYGALEPYIDEQTMVIHHTKHHQTYIDKLNVALEKFPDLAAKPVEALIANLATIPEEIKSAVQNHGGGHLNHSFFWLLLKKEVAFDGPATEAITKQFGSFDQFKTTFTQAALNRFGSGWTWLVDNNGQLEIISTPNQDSPLTQGKTPILGLDVWEHAYYLKYQNKRPDYIEAFFQVINWRQVNENFLALKPKQ